MVSLRMSWSLFGIVAVTAIVVLSAPVAIAVPEANDLILQASGPNSLDDDDLYCTFSLSDAVAASVAWYRDGAPNSALYLPIEGGSANGLIDFSGNGLTVTAAGTGTAAAAWRATDGHNGTGAYQFGAAFWVNAGTMFPIQSSYTKAAWIKRTGNGSNNIMSGASSHVWYASSSSKQSRMSAGHNGNYTIVQDPDSLDLNVWYFVALTFEYSTGEMILYKDGVEVDRGTATVSERELTDDGLYIGAFANSSPWAGLIDEARVYDYALPPDRVAALYSSPSTMDAVETTVGEDWQVGVTPFSATEAGTTVLSNILTVNADPPDVAGIPDQTVAEGATFAAISLDAYVTDPNHLDSDMSWTYSGASEFSVSIVDRVATVTIPDADWFGGEAITFRATDPDGLYDEDEVQMTVTNVNDPPVVGDIPDNEVDEGAVFATITLDDFVNDIDDPDEDLTWTYSGNVDLQVSIIDRQATVTPPHADWNGAETITFTAEDASSATDFDGAVFTVNAVNDPPEVSDIPGETTDEGGAFAAIDLSGYVTDIDNAPGDISWDYGGNVDLNVDITGTVATVSAPYADWNGAETITFYAEDLDAGVGSDDVLFTVNPINDAPVVDDIPDQVISGSAFFATVDLDDYVSDVDNLDAEMTWTATGAVELTVEISGRVAAVTAPSPAWRGTEVVTFEASDPGLLTATDAASYTMTDPVVSGVSLDATSPEALSEDDLVCSYTLEGSATTAATAWVRNGSPMMTLYGPFEGGAANALLDLSGSGNNMTTFGDPDWSATGGHDGHGAWVLDGSDHLEAGECFPTLSSYTKTAWVYRTGSGSNNILSGDIAAGGHVLFASSSSHASRVAAGQAGNWAIVEDTDSLELDTWYFIAVTFDYATGEMVLYRDGAEVDRATAALTHRDVTDATADVGSFMNSSQWVGTIDDARIYGIALTGEQILAMYTHGDARIAYSETDEADVWQVQVTPFSPADMGMTVASNELMINIEDPVVSNVVLAATTPLNVTFDDLTCSYDLQGTATTAAVAWYVDAAPLMTLYAPMEGGPGNGLLDLSGRRVCAGRQRLPERRGGIPDPGVVHQDRLGVPHRSGEQQHHLGQRRARVFRLDNIAGRCPGGRSQRRLQRR